MFDFECIVEFGVNDVYCSVGINFVYGVVSKVVG